MKSLPRLLTPLAFLSLLAAVVGCFSGDTYIIRGNLHDLWIPQMGAYAVKRGMVLHEEFHTFFGFFYNGLNYLSLLIIEGFPGLFVPADMIMLSSALFSIPLALLFLLMRANKKPVAWFILVVVLSNVFQAKGISTPLGYKMVLWYESYNYHLWSLLLLQAAHAFSWSKRTDDSGSVRLLPDSLIQASCVYIAFNYKMNFFASSSLVAASVFFLLPNGARLRYGLTSIGLFALLLLPALLLGYSYTGYFGDLAHAAQSRGRLFHFEDLKYALAYCLCLFVIQYRKKLSLRKIARRKGELLKNLALCALTSLAIFTGLAGVWQKSLYYYPLFLILYAAVAEPRTPPGRTSLFLLSLFFLTNLLPLVYTAQKKFHAQETPKYRPIDLMAERDDFLIDNRIDRLGSYTKFHTRLPKDERIFLKMTYSFKEVPWDVPFFNARYYDMLKDAVGRIREAGHDGNDKALLVEFINPLPLLLDSAIAPGTYHWIHFGATFSTRKNVHRLYEAFAGSDFVYVPTMTIQWPHQSFFNCLFYEWNFAEGRFAFHSINRHGLLFVKGGNPPSDDIVTKWRSGVEEGCKTLNSMNLLP